MMNPKQIYNAVAKYARRQVAEAATVMAFAFAKPADISLEQMLPSTVQLPPDTNSPEYQRQMQIWRFHANRDTELQMESYDRNSAILRQSR